MAHWTEQIITQMKLNLPNRKDTDRVCKPSKELHLNLKGHTQGVNCIRWNVTESNNHLLVSASMGHKVCVWDTHDKVELVRKVWHVILKHRCGLAHWRLCVCVCGGSSSCILTLYTLTSVCIFSILFSVCFLRCSQGEFGKQCRTSLVSDHFI